MPVKPEGQILMAKDIPDTAYGREIGELTDDVNELVNDKHVGVIISAITTVLAHVLADCTDPAMREALAHDIGRKLAEASTVIANDAEGRIN
jgi:hypothetical protein